LVLCQGGSENLPAARAGGFRREFDKRREFL